MEKQSRHAETSALKCDLKRSRSCRGKKPRQVKVWRAVRLQVAFSKACLQQAIFESTGFHLQI